VNSRTHAVVLSSLLTVACYSAQAEEHYGNFFATQPQLEYVYDAVTVGDMLTTLDIRQHPASQVVETNPVLGSRPSNVRVVCYFATSLALHAAITYELVSNDVPEPVINAWEYISIGFESAYVGHNLSIGLHFHF
jgi:hypothetical protein